MEPPISPLLFSIILFASMVLLLEAGRYFGLKRQSRESDSEKSNLGAIEGAVFAMFGLLIAFTFGGAALRFNEKRMLIADEANTIGTAYLRLQLLPQEERSALTDAFRRYVDTRLETYRKLPNLEAAAGEMKKSKMIQEEIWSKAVAATRLPDSHTDAGKLLLPALNSMFDITTTRAMALQIHPPAIIYHLLFALGLICALLAGYRMAAQHRSWLHLLGFAAITAVIVFVILDVEYPRAGLFRIEAADQVLVDIRQGMR